MKELGYHQIEKTLAAKHACYVLITCDVADEENETMDVQMRFGGDPTLASFVIEGAKKYIDDYAEETLLV